MSYVSSTTDICTISGTTITAVSPGTCSITASQAGNNLYDPADPVTVLFTVNPAKPVISNISLASGNVSSAYSQTLTATGGTGTYTNWTKSSGTMPPGLSLNSSTGVISGTPTTSGTYSVTFTVDSGTLDTGAANTSNTKTYSIVIDKVAQTITFPTPSNVVVDATTSASATSSSGLAVTLTGNSDAYCTISGGVVTGVAAGTCSITASQEGDSTYAAATSVTRTFTVIPKAPVISTTSLAGGTISSAYSQTLAATLGDGTYTNWTLVSGPLPAGLTMNSSTGVISGTPTTSGTYAVSFSVDSANQTSATKALSIVISKIAQTISFTTPQDMVVPDTQSAGATATSALTVSYLSTDTSICTISAGGTITAVAAGTCEITASQAGNSSYSAATPVVRSFTVLPTPPIVSTSSLNDGTINSSYSQTLSASRGNGSYSNWTVASGSLPPGVTLNSSTGELSGTPTTAGTYTVHFTVKSGVQTSVQKSLSIVVNKIAQSITFATPATMIIEETQGAGATASSNLAVTYESLDTTVCTVASDGTITAAAPGDCQIKTTQAGNGSYSAANSVTRIFTVLPKPPVISTASLAGGTISSAYSHTLAATLGNGSYSNWTLSAGSLPPGVTLNDATGVLSGTPTTSGIYSVTFTVDSGSQRSATKTLSISISKRSQAITFTLPTSVHVGDDTSANGTADSNLVVDYISTNTSICTYSAGVITAVSAGTCEITAKQAGNSTFSAASDVAVQMLIRLKAPVITTTSVVDGTIGSSYVETLAAIEGDGNYSNWVITAGSLPPGVHVNQATGAITGNPTASGTYTVTFTVDSDNQTSATRQLSFVVNKKNQAITFTAPAPITTGSTTLAGALADSSLAVEYETNSPARCTIASDGTITAVSAGTCIITAKQSGNSDFNAATDVQRSFTIHPGPPFITNSSLITGHVSSSYSETLAASDGDGTYSNFRVDAGTLPPGLSLNANTGELTGTPTASGTYNVSFTVDSGPQRSVVKSLTIEIHKRLQSISFTTPSTLTVDETAAAGASADSNLNVDYTSGDTSVCSVAADGTITAVGFGTCIITAKQPGNGTFEPANDVARSFEILPKAPVITTASLSGGHVALGYSRTLSASLGYGSYSNWRLDSGSLPPGLSIDSTTGEISGTPTASGTYNAVFRVSSRTIHSATKALSILISKQSQSIAFANPGSMVVDDTVAAGASADSSLSVSYVSTDPSVCTVAADGTITAVDFGDCEITASQAGNGTYSAASNVVRQFTVSPKHPVITTSSLADGTVATAYSRSLAASLGYRQYSNWAVASGSLPPGVTLNSSTGELSGTPTASGTYSVQFTVDSRAMTSVRKALSIVVNKKSQTIAFSQPGTMTIDDTAAAGATATSSLSVAYSTNNASICTVASNGTITAVGAGTCIVTATQSGNGTYSAASNVAQSFTIRHKAPVITTSSLNDGRIGSAFSQSLAATLGNGTYSNWTVVSGSLPPGLSISSSTGAITGTPTTAGTYSISFRVESASRNSAAKTLDIVVNKRLQSLSVSNVSKTYGDADFTPSATATSGLVIGFSSSNTSVVSVNGTTLRVRGAGTATITATQPGNSAYAPASNATFTVTVARAALTVTAPSFAKTYGDAKPTLTPTYSGFVSGESASDLTSSATCDTAFDSNTQVSASPVAVNCSGAASPNYVVTAVAGSISIAKAQLSVTAPSVEVTYGSASPTLTPVISGFVSGDNINDLNGSIDCFSDYLRTTPVSSSGLRVDCVADPDPNYTFAFTSGAITITKAPLTVTAGSVSVSYGDAKPTISRTYSGWLNGQDATVLNVAPSCNTAYAATTPVSSSPVATTCSGGSDDNYRFVYSAGSLTISKAELQVAAPNLTVTYGDNRPTLTPRVTGFVNGQSQADLAAPVSCSTDYVRGTSVALSPVAVTCTAQVDANYSFRHVAGELVIERATLTATASSPVVIFGDAVPRYDVSFAGFVNGETESALTNLGVCFSSYSPATEVGDDPAVECSSVEAVDYVVNYVDGKVTVNKASASLDVNPADLEDLQPGGSQQIEIISDSPATPIVEITGGCTYDAINGRVLAPATIDGTEVTCEITVSLPASKNYNSTPAVTKQFKVAGQAKAARTVTLAIDKLGTVFDINTLIKATATAEPTTDAIEYVSRTSNVCTVDATGAITLVTAGECTLYAHVAENDEFSEAFSSDVTFSVTKAVRELTLSVAPTTLDVGQTALLNHDFLIGSGEVVYVLASGGPECSLNGAKLTANGAAVCRVYSYAPETARALRTVSNSVTITFNAVRVIPTSEPTTEPTSEPTVTPTPTPTPSKPATAVLPEPAKQSAPVGIVIVPDAPARTEDSVDTIDIGTGEIQVDPGTALSVTNTEGKGKETIAKFAASSFKGFSAGSGISVKIIGARTIGQFVNSGTAAANSAAFAAAITESSARNAVDFTQIKGAKSVSAPAPKSILGGAVTEDALDLFASSGLPAPQTVGNVLKGDEENWVKVDAKVQSYQPGSVVYLTVTSSPLIFGAATVDKFGKADFSGLLPIESLELGAHSIRVIGVRVIDGVKAGADGSISVPERAVQEIERFDQGTKATVRLVGANETGGIHAVVREIYLDKYVPWWSLWVAIAGFVIWLLVRLEMRRRRARWTRRARNVSVVLILALGLLPTIAAWVTISYDLLTWAVIDLLASLVLGHLFARKVSDPKKKSRRSA
ncbi:MAG: putative Ig domain-containing protein [Microbacteriaceae bacterium]